MLLTETCYYLENQGFGGVNTRDMSLIKTCFCSRLYGMWFFKFQNLVRSCKHIGGTPCMWWHKKLQIWQNPTRPQARLKGSSSKKKVWSQKIPVWWQILSSTSLITWVKNEIPAPLALEIQKKNNILIILKMNHKSICPFFLSFSVSKGYYILGRAGIQQLSEGFVSFDHESANQIRLRQRT